MKIFPLLLTLLFLFFTSRVMSSCSGFAVTSDLMYEITLEKLNNYASTNPQWFDVNELSTSRRITEQKDLPGAILAAICIGDTTARNILCSHLFKGQDLRAPEMSDADLGKLVLDMIEDVNCPDDYLRTPLDNAAEFGRMDIVELILPKVKLGSAEPTDWGTPIMSALKEGHVAVAERLWQWVESTDPGLLKGNSLLHFAVERWSPIEAVRYLLSKSAHVNEKNEDGYTPLALAERNDRCHVAYLIREKIQSACDAAN